MSVEKISSFLEELGKYPPSQCPSSLWFAISHVIPLSIDSKSELWGEIKREFKAREVSRDFDGPFELSFPHEPSRF